MSPSEGINLEVAWGATADFELDAPMGHELDSSSAAGRRAAADRARGLAAIQEGIVTHAELLAIGMTPKAITGWLSHGWLAVIHRGVYLLSSPVPSSRAREMAAVKAVGPKAAVSHAWAATLLQLPLGTLALGRLDGAVDVTVAGTRRTNRLGIRLHQVPTLLRVEVRVEGRLPLTSPARTIVDMARLATPRQLERMIAEGHALGLVSEAELVVQLRRSQRRPGIPKLRAVLAEVTGPPLTRSEAEERLLGLIDRAGLPRPEANARVAGLEVDLLWRAERLVIEVDGYAFHSSRSAFERDHERRQRLVLAGYRALGFSWRQIVEKPAQTIARISAALAGPWGP